MLGRLRRLISAPPASEQRNLELAGRNIPYTLKRSAKRRSIGLRIDHRGLTVSMPARTPQAWLERVLEEKALWIVDKLDAWQAQQAALPVWADGQRIPYQGRHLVLRVEQGGNRPRAELREEVLLITTAKLAEPAQLESMVTRWYRRQAMELFQSRLACLAAQMRLAPTELRLSSARTRWGSCNSRGTIRLNWRLIQLPSELLDYVIVHELAHLQEMNHSAAFWKVVEKTCPDWQTRRAELRRWNAHIKRGI